MKKHGPEWLQIVRLDMDDPADLAILARSGYIWKTPYAQKAIDAIVSGAISLDDCKDVPAGIRSALEAR